MKEKQTTPGAMIKTTTKRREWWGWFGSAAWMFCMMYGYDMFLSAEGKESIPPIVFMGLFALSVAAFGWKFGNDADGLSKIAFYTTPFALLITAVFALLPQPLGSVLYMISPVLMAPAFTRRIYGIIRTAGADRQLTRYMSCVSACVAVFTFWIISEPPKEISFLVPALLTIPIWLGIRRRLPVQNDPVVISTLRISKKLSFTLLGTVIVLFLFNFMNTIIHTEIAVIAGLQEANTLYTLLGFLLPPLAFVLYGIISDKGHERVGFICGMGLCIVGILLTLLSEDIQSALLLPLAITDGLGASYTEFFIVTIPIYFIISTKRPVFIAALGMVFWLASSALQYIPFYMPEAFLTISIPLLVSTAILAVIFAALVFILFERHRENTLAAALFALMRYNENTVSESDTEPGGVMLENGFTKEEKDVALLLTEGLTQYEISRKLRLTSGEVGKHIKTLREKVAGISDPDPKIAAIIKKYKLTTREAGMLRCLCQSMTNYEIAEENFMSEETARVNIHRLIKKLPVENRADVAEWVESYAGN